MIAVFGPTKKIDLTKVQDRNFNIMPIQEA